MEKLVDLPFEVLEIIFQQINHHMVIALMPLHSQFHKIGQKKLYKNIHIYVKCNSIKDSSTEANKPKHTSGNRWRAHKDILNDFTRKFTVISLCCFYNNIIMKKIDRYQHVQHLSIEDVESVFYPRNSLSREYPEGAPSLRKIFKYFKNLDYVSFAMSNNQLDSKNIDSSHDLMVGVISWGVFYYLRDFVAALERNYQVSYNFLYDNLKSFKFYFLPSHSSGMRYNCDTDLIGSINTFNKINSFKKLEELHLVFENLVDLMDPSLLGRLNKINCKLKKLDLTFWGKLKYSDHWDSQAFYARSKPGKWLFTLNEFFDTKEIISLSLDYHNKTYSADHYIFQEFNFEEILCNANLPKLRNLVLSSPTLDLKSIDVSNLHKLLICTEIANDKYAAEIAKLYLINSNLRLSWWPRFMSQVKHEFCTWDNLQINTPDYFQVISCQWPSYLFTSDKISIERIESTSDKKGLVNHNHLKQLDIGLKNEYSIEELYEMDLFNTFIIEKSVLEVIKRNEHIPFLSK
ncbi:uncharacterized protein KGF55_001987 [Candida pseudojiufengensis]|uniref:uncharacterized protein n=1 Tax=Candida pseudojiufengensis TaxID=497109 RepID=UPI002225A4DB|nr:uncharacterized protein KGF55_001987 [Candida pseudojiufengensis]KAI5964045.1 hypothetical protein KGF55_001987 [Candida pseudojiufengensis]